MHWRKKFQNTCIDTYLCPNVQSNLGEKGVPQGHIKYESKKNNVFGKTARDKTISQVSKIR